MFEDKFFKNKPAIASLQKVDQPKPDHLRSCVLELCAHIIRRGQPVVSNQEIEDFIARKGTDNIIGAMIAQMKLTAFMENVAWIVNQEKFSDEIHAKFNKFVEELRDILEN